MACSPMVRIKRWTRFRLVALPDEPHLYAPRPVEGRDQILLVYPLHEGQVLRGSSPEPVVQAGSADVQQGTLPNGGQGRMFTVHHLPPPLPAHGPDLSAKKSRSTFSWPICW